MDTPDINLDRLLKLRLAVARFGEMDIARWWNTKGQLGRMGASTLRRGFPRTHHFAQARSVVAVAAHRCIEVFDPPQSVTLWRLPAGVEDAFDARWEHWLDHADEWSEFFRTIETIEETDLPRLLGALELVTDKDVRLSSSLRTSAEGRAVPLPNIYSGSDADVALLALGFGHGAPGALAVPYARYETA